MILLASQANAAEPALDVQGTMQPSVLQLNGFVELLSGCRDAAELILRRLPLQGLAAVSATCKGLRASVPEAVWQHAARLEYPCAHPVLKATSVPAYLRRQHSTHAAIDAGRFTLREVHTKEGILSADFQQHATMVQSEGRVELVVTQLLSGATLHSVRLPEGLPYLHRLWFVQYSPGGGTLAILYGGEWAARHNQDWLRDVPLGTSGLVLASLQTGLCQTVVLPPQLRLLQAGLRPWFSGWSSETVCLAVLHIQADGAAVISVYDAPSARKVASIEAPDVIFRLTSTRLDTCRLVWSPCGQIYKLPGSTFLHLWRPFASSAGWQSMEVGWTRDLQDLQWSPCSSMLLLSNSEPERYCVLCDTHGHVQRQALTHSQQELTWGLSGILSLDERRCSELDDWSLVQKVLWSSVVDLTLQPPYLTVCTAPRDMDDQPSISPDGRHCACITKEVRQVSVDSITHLNPCLQLISSESGTVFQHFLSPLPHSWVEYHSIQWSEDGSQLICSFWYPHPHAQHFIFSFQ